MKQTVEEAAKEAIHKHYNCNGTYPCSEREYCEHCNGRNTAFSCCECGADEFKDGFIAGAKWQARQSPWISVDEQLPETDDNILLLSKMNRSGEYFVQENSYGNGDWAVKSTMFYTPIAWMPIPSFDEIFEDNKDVLERIN